MEEYSIGNINGLHVFVAMPLGIKDGIDFNQIYTSLIKPALEEVGFEVYRAYKEMHTGKISPDMLQELLLADVVVAELSSGDPDVWYTLGVRHALRARGVISLHNRGDCPPFDVHRPLQLRYHIKDGVPDPDFLAADKTALACMAQEILAASPGRPTSPLYSVLRYLQEPDWKSLRLDEAREFWEQQNRIEAARKKLRPADIMVLAEEAPVQVLRQEAHLTAATVLIQLGQVSLALEQVEKALAIDPGDVESRQLKGELQGLLNNPVPAAARPEALVAEEPWQPRRVFLFSGHTIDPPGRPDQRFPQNKVKIAAAAIAQKL